MTVLEAILGVAVAFLLFRDIVLIEKRRRELRELRAALTEIAQFSQTENLLWWQQRARAALSLSQHTGEDDG